MNPTTSLGDKRIQDVRTAVAAIVLACPLEDNFEECPAFKQRQKSMQDRLTWVMGLSQTDCEQLYERHLICLQQRA